VKRKPSA